MSSRTRRTPIPTDTVVAIASSAGGLQALSTVLAALPATFPGAIVVVQRDLRRSVIFGRHDLIQDPPISRINLLSCRNTLMYLNAETQGRIFERFHFALLNDGFLFLGKAETLLAHSKYFLAIDLKRRVFMRTAHRIERERLVALAQASEPVVEAHQIRVREVAFDVDIVAQIIVDTNGTLMLASERARALFSLTPQDVGRPFQDLEISYKPIELRSLVTQVQSERRPVPVKDIEWASPIGPTVLDILVSPLYDGLELLGVKVAFRDVTTLKHLQNELQRANAELETASEELQSSNEELETTNEELQSTVEELETTNEELQSTNEELETMNEELQSTNEELQTANDEMRQRSDELNRVNTFFQQVLGNLRDAVIVVDREMRVQVWNGRSEDLWGLRADEVRGATFTSLDIGLPVDALAAPIRGCLSDGSGERSLTVDATNRRGRKIQLRVSCSPFHRKDELGPGAILIMEEIGA